MYKKQELLLRQLADSLEGFLYKTLCKERFLVLLSFCTHQLLNIEENVSMSGCRISLGANDSQNQLGSFK